MQHFGQMILILLFVLASGSTYGAQCNKSNRSQLPKPPAILGQDTGPQQQASSATDFASAQHIQASFARATSIYVATMIEVIPADIMNRTQSKSTVMLLHAWSKEGWKKPQRKKQDLEIDLAQVNCGFERKVQLKANQKYLLYYDQKEAFIVLPMDNKAPAVTTTRMFLEALGEESWYYDRVDNLVRLKK